jgi:hypothetical protein
MGASALQVAHRSVGQLRDRAAEYAEEGRDQVHSAERALRRFVREQPLKSALIGASLAVAVGAGVLLGRFFWMRRETQQSHAAPRYRW